MVCTIVFYKQTLNILYAVFSLLHRNPIFAIVFSNLRNTFFNFSFDSSNNTSSSTYSR